MINISDLKIPDSYIMDKTIGLPFNTLALLRL